MTGAGADIWGGADAFQFLSQPVGGSIDLIAQVTSEQNTNTYAKAGLMLRQSFDPGSPMVILDVRPGGGIEFMDRSSAAGAVRFRAGSSASIPSGCGSAPGAGRDRIHIAGRRELDAGRRHGVRALSVSL